MCDHKTDAWHFVIASPRSGSTWLTRALNQHPNVMATENRLFGMFCEIWKNPSGKLAPRITADQYIRSFANHSFFHELGFADSATMQEAFAHEYFRFIGRFLREKSGKSTIVDKVTPYLGTSSKVLNQIAKYFPDARLIQLIRDGRDVAVSGVFDWIGRENEGSDRYRLFVEGDASVTVDRLFDDELLERWARYWTEPLQAMAANDVAPLQIRYEDMLANQADVLQSSFEYLGLEADPELATQCAAGVTFEKLTGRVSGQAQDLAKARKGIAGDWKNYFTRRDAEVYRELTGDLLQQLGYEPDKTWAEHCPVELNLDARC